MVEKKERNGPKRCRICLVTSRDGPGASQEPRKEQGLAAAGFRLLGCSFRERLEQLCPLGTGKQRLFYLFYFVLLLKRQKNRAEGFCCLRTVISKRRQMPSGLGGTVNPITIAEQAARPQRAFGSLSDDTPGQPPAYPQGSSKAIFS